MLNPAGVGVTFHPRRSGDLKEDFLISGFADYAFRVFEDGSDQIGGMLVSGQPVGALSGSFLAISHKDACLKATSVPIGELKTTVSIAQSAFSLTALVEQLGNSRRAVVIETNSQSANLSAQGYSGTAHFIRHLRRSLLVLLRQFKAAGLIDLHLVKKGGKDECKQSYQALGSV